MRLYLASIEELSTQALPLLTPCIGIHICHTQILPLHVQINNETSKGLCSHGDGSRTWHSPSWKADMLHAELILPFLCSWPLLQPVMLSFQKNRAAALGRPPPGTFSSSHTHLAAGGCPAAQIRTSINDASAIPLTWRRWRSYSYHYLTPCRQPSCFSCSGLSWGRQAGRDRFSHGGDCETLYFSEP